MVEWVSQWYGGNDWYLRNMPVDTGNNMYDDGKGWSMLSRQESTYIPL